MKIELKELSKNFNRSKIFNNINFTFTSDNSYTILGSNGSGKSTLLNLLCGNTTPTSGNLSFEIDNHSIGVDNIYQHVSFAAPYLDLYEDLTLKESIKLHSSFKSFYNSYSIPDIINILKLEKNTNKQLKDFSSGMLQRVKLGLAILSKTPFLFLDEPTINLDSKNIEWYQSLIDQHKSNRLIIIASNNQKEESILQDIKFFKTLTRIF